MSHDLHFCRPYLAERTAGALASFCQRIPHLKQTTTGEQAQWWYENPDTGVYFSFEYGSAREKRPTLRQGFYDAGFSFNMNYVRPRFFAEEAMPVVQDLCGALDLLVVDPQDREGGGYGQPKAARTEELVETWVEGNRAAIRAYCTKFKVRPLTMPHERATAWWRYQRDRAALQDHLGDEIHVPSLLLLHDKENTRLLTGIGWGDAVPILLPPCDIVFIQREEQPGGAENAGPAVQGWIASAAVREALGSTLTRFTWRSWKLDALEPINARRARGIFDELPLQPTLEQYQGIAPDAFLDEKP